MFWPASEWRRAVDAANCCVINVFHAKSKVVALDIRQWDKMNRDNPLNWYLSSRPCYVMEINQTLPVAQRTQTIDCVTRMILLIANFVTWTRCKFGHWVAPHALLTKCPLTCVVAFVCASDYATQCTVQLLLCNYSCAIVKRLLLQCNVQWPILEYEDLHTFAQVFFAYIIIITYSWNLNYIACLIGACYCFLFVAWVALN